MDLLSIAVVMLAAIIIGVAYLVKEITGIKYLLKNGGVEKSNLQLQAYERLAVFADRAGLKNLISRSDTFGQSAAILHGVLIEAIKSEYDYNVSQQVYVSKEIWEAVTKLKDQNIYIINQLAGALPPHATSLDLSKRILEYGLTQNTELNAIVLDAIQHEAKKLLG